jgi:hypothetical protein
VNDDDAVDHAPFRRLNKAMVRDPDGTQRPFEFASPVSEEIA